MGALAASLHAIPLSSTWPAGPRWCGWPSCTPRRSVDEYLWEEVIRSSSRTTRALLALCLLGPSGVDDVEAVIERPFDPDGFLARVPLVHRDR